MEFLNLIYFYLLITGVSSGDSKDLSEINLTNITTISSLEYLGCGYNLLFRNLGEKKGEEIQAIDTNYRNPVVKFKWSGDMSNLNNTLEYLHPIGTYIYNFPNCSITQENKVENTSKKVQNMINSEVSVDLVNLKADANSNKFKKNTKKEKNLEKIIYCSVYIAGINSSNKVEFTKDFKLGIVKMKRVLRTEYKKGCTLKNYGRKVCHKVREAWNDFFKSFGTHYVTKIVLGGKLVYKEENKGNTEGQKNTKNLGINLKVLDLNKSNNTSKTLNEVKDANNTDVFGGITFESNKEWFNQLKTNPIPIKMALTSFKEVMAKHHLSDEYARIIQINAISQANKARNRKSKKPQKN